MDKLKGPQKGEMWTIGSHRDLIFMGQGRNFKEQKFFVFRKPDGSFFILDKDEFFLQELYKRKQTHREEECRNLKFG